MAISVGLAIVLMAGCANSRPQSELDGAYEMSSQIAKGTTDANVISSEEMDRSAVTCVEKLLEGRIAGVQVLKGAGGRCTLRIRGNSSIFGSNEPLYVIDGMPLRSLAGLNPHDVARIEVLKDVASTAMYGMRGANGVVLIMTKRAR